MKRDEGKYFGAVNIQIGAFPLQLTSPSGFIESPYCIPPNTPQNSDCTCIEGQPCEQIWEFASTQALPSYDGQFQFTWEVFENFNSIGASVNSFFDLQLVVFDQINRTLTLPIDLQLYDSQVSALNGVSVRTTFGSGERIFVFPFLDAQDRNQFKLQIDTLMVCFIPNNGTLLSQDQVTDNQWGCRDTRIQDGSRRTLISNSVAQTFDISNQFSVEIFSEGAVEFSAVPLSTQPYDRYYIHAIYRLEFTNQQQSSSRKRTIEVVSRQESATTTGTGVSLKPFIISGAADPSINGNENDDKKLSTGSIVAISVSALVILLLLIIVPIAIWKIKNKYKKLEGI